MRPALRLVSVAWGSEGGGDFLPPHPPVQRGPPRRPLGRQLLAGSPRQAQPGGGQKVVQALPSLRGPPRPSLSVGIGLGGQGRRVVTVLSRNLSVGFPWKLPCQLGSLGLLTTQTQPYIIVKLC